MVGDTILIPYCVYRDLKTKGFVHFHFQFEVDFTFNDIKVKNV